MTRALGVFVVLLALAATATAEKAPAKKPAPTKQAAGKQAADKQAADKQAAGKADADQPADADATAEGSDAELTPEEMEAALPPHITGPKLVDLGHNIEIDLPAGMVLLEHDAAKQILEKGGDSAENVVALIARLDATSSWELLVDYADVGYVSDKDANELDPNDLFQQYVAGTNEQNARRRTLGVPELFLDGWSEKPKYDVIQHHLMWGFNVHTTEGPAINAFRRILGRNGYLSVNLVDSPDKMEAAKADAAGVIGSIHFRTGFRYEDHKDGDRDSGLGLKALVLGGAGIAVVKAAKAGIIIKLLLVFKKGIIFIFAGVAGFFRWITGRKKKEDDVLPSQDPPSSAPPPSEPPPEPPVG